MKKGVEVWNSLDNRLSPYHKWVFIIQRYQLCKLKIF
jgi:hypothetical protein